MNNDFSGFQKFIEQFGYLANNDKETLAGCLTTANLAKGDHFLKIGRVCNSIGFILDGVMRIYYIDDEGKEINKVFYQRAA